MCTSTMGQHTCLSLAILWTVAAMNDVPPCLYRQVPANSARLCIERVGRADEFPSRCHDAIPLPHLAIRRSVF